MLNSFYVVFISSYGPDAPLSFSDRQVSGVPPSVCLSVQNGCPTLASDWSKCSTSPEPLVWNRQACQKFPLYVFRAIHNPTWQSWHLIGWYIFSFIFQNWFIRNHQTCHKYSPRGSEEVRLVFGVIWNPRLPKLWLVEIFGLFSRKTAKTWHLRNITWFQYFHC